MAALGIGVYDDFVSDTLQSDMADIRGLDDHEIDLVGGGNPYFVLVVGIIAVATVVILVTYGCSFRHGYNSVKDPPPVSPQPPQPSGQTPDNGHHVMPAVGRTGG
jgi:hypothetical protein